ncbi:hypothetical protein ACFL08_00600 [Patescibacteria group bacterium]
MMDLVITIAILGTGTMIGGKIFKLTAGHITELAILQLAAAAFYYVASVDILPVNPKFVINIVVCSTLLCDGFLQDPKKRNLKRTLLKIAVQVIAILLCAYLLGDSISNLFTLNY